MRTRVKICGITRIEDLTAAVDAGADAIGLVFYPGSARAVTIQTANQLLAVVPPFVSTVGLFVNADAAEDEEWATYEMVEDEEELISVSKVFEQLMDDINFEVE